MSVIDPDVLQALGARPTGLRAPIPLYMRVYQVTGSGVPLVNRLVPHDLSSQHLAALILEIPDYLKLRRYVFEKWNKKNRISDMIIK